MQFHSFRLDHLDRHVPGECRLPDDGADLTAVLVLTDILLSRRHGFYPFLAETLASDRLVVSIDAALSGYSAGSTDVDVGVARTYSLGSEVVDALAVLTALEDGTLPCSDVWDGQRLALIGHGKGAAVALHLDRRLREEGRPAPTALALLAAPATLVREGWVGDEDRGLAVPVDPPSDGDGPDMVTLTPEFFDDARGLAETATLKELIATTPTPVLVVAGEEDVVFPVAESEELMTAARAPKDRLVVVEKAGHHFGAGHPFGGAPTTLVHANDVIDRFLRE